MRGFLQHSVRNVTLPYITDRPMVAIGSCGEKVWRFGERVENLQENLMRNPGARRVGLEGFCEVGFSLGPQIRLTTIVCGSLEQRAQSAHGVAPPLHNNSAMQFETHVGSRVSTKRSWRMINDQ